VDPRYARQVRLPEWGPDGQAALRKAKVLVAGLGGLGAPAAHALAAAGVGTLGLCDRDNVEISNLHRQPLYASADVGRPKVQAAADRIAAVNPDVQVRKLTMQLSRHTVAKAVAGYDLVVDGLDGLDGRYALSDACTAAGIPHVVGALAGWEGQVAVFPPGGPCYRCLHPEPPAEAGPSCADEGVFAPLAGAVAQVQAGEALKALLGMNGLAGRLWLLDGRDWSARTITLKHRPGCRCTMTATADHATRKLPAKPTSQGNPHQPHELPPEGTPVACPLPWAAPDVPVVLAEVLKGHESEVFVLDVREPDEWEEGHIEGATLIPLGSLQRRLAEVPTDRQVVVVCAVGGRSARATHFLRGHGIEAVNLHGGMRAYLSA